MTSEANQRVIENLIRWRSDVVAFVREFFGAEPDAWQEEFLRAVTKNMRLALKACKGPGKTTALAWVAWWCLVCFPNPKMVATSITEDNLRDNLWAEMSKWQQKNEFLKAAYTWTAERIFLTGHQQTWFLSARNWPKSADPSQQANTLAGIHADVVMFLIDEAGGIPDAVVAAAEAGLANADPAQGRFAWLILAGNPTHLSGPLYRACTKERGLWWVKAISSAPDDPQRTPRVSKQWAQEQIDKYGADSPYVLVNVFGEFPPGQSNALIAQDVALTAAERTMTHATFIDAPVILGVDVARYGDDASVILKRQGRMCFKPRVFRNLSLMDLADQVALEIERERPDAVFIDQTGVGAGVVDRLRQLGHSVIGVDGASKPTIDKPAVLNRRVQMWWLMADWLKESAIPNDAELVAELTGPTYWFDRSGRLVLEGKDDMKARGVASPNKADALGLTFAAPVVRKPAYFPGQQQHRHRAIIDDE